MNNLPEKVMRKYVLEIARKAIVTADVFGLGQFSAVKNALEMEDIYLKDFQIESILKEILF